MGRPRKRRREGDGPNFTTFDAEDVLLDDGMANESVLCQSLSTDQATLIPVNQSAIHQLQDDYVWNPSNDLAGLEQFGFPALDNLQVSGSRSRLGQEQFAQFGDPSYGFLDLPRDAIDDFVKTSASGHFTDTLEPHTDDINQSSGPGCECLTKMYLTLASFQNLPPPSFPQSLGILKKATNLAQVLLRCKECIKKYASAVQNLMLLCTILTLISNEYAVILDHIEKRATSDKTITLRIGEQSPETQHLHTKSHDCPMGFSITLSGEEWGAMARKAIKKEVLGAEGQESGLLGLVDEMERRQRTWHKMPARADQGRCSTCEGHKDGASSSFEGGSETCLSLVNNVRRCISGLDL